MAAQRKKQLTQGGNGRDTCIGKTELYREDSCIGKLYREEVEVILKLAPEG